MKKKHEPFMGHVVTLVIITTSFFITAHAFALGQDHTDSAIDNLHSIQCRAENEPDCMMNTQDACADGV